MLELNAKTTALVVIDLQEGILPFAGGPHTADEVVNRAGKLAAKFRANGQPVFLVRVGWSADYAEALKQPVDAPPRKSVARKLVATSCCIRCNRQRYRNHQTSMGCVLRYGSGVAITPPGYRYNSVMWDLDQYRC